MTCNSDKQRKKATTKKRAKKLTVENLDGTKMFIAFCRTVVLISTLIVAQNAMRVLDGQEDSVWIFLGTVAGCATLGVGGLSQIIVKEK